MEMIIQIALLIIGFVFLVKGADMFVDGASNIAYNFKIPTLIVGLTIVAFGTSAPEAAVSIAASVAGNNAISIGNVVGSNIFNLLCIIGICALIATLPVDKELLKRDFPVVLGATILLVLFAHLFGELSRIIGILFLALIIIYVYLMVKKAKSNPESCEIEEAKFGMGKSVIFLIIGLVGIILGAEFVVNSASYLASMFGLSDALIGLTIVAIGTSLPELVTSLTALKKGDHGIVIGNIIGSCLFNILFILGISSAIVPMPIAPAMMTDLIFLLAITGLSYIFANTKDKFDRKEGLILFVLFVIYMAF
ncbi:MAG: calcium/sodium antiporter, partial [Methanobacteriaceae archaeon]|nr:calcium/sodium antiporter [Methanobacteriaceae archaeon]